MSIEIVDILDLLRGAANFSFHLTIAWSPHRDHLSVSSIGDRGTNGTKSDLEEALDGPPRQKNPPLPRRDLNCISGISICTAVPSL